MTFRQFAFKNVTRNKRLYAAYFLSSLFTVMVFFTFANFAFHPALHQDGMNQNVLFGMSVAGGIIYVFSFFFVLYSMSSFLQSRKKEFGVLMIQGMSTRQIRWMIFLENMLLGFFAIIIGMGLGLLFSKLILLIAENVLVIDRELNYYFPTMAIIITFISFMILFVCISVFVTFILRTNKLIALIKGDKIAKSEPKASIWLTLLAILLLGIGYAVALKVKGLMVVTAMIPVIIVVIIGTYFMFTQLSVYVINRLKKNEHVFWHKTNMLTFADLSFRMKDNARAFFMVAIISTVAFSAIGTLIGMQSYLFKGMKEANPLSIVYSISSETKKEVTEKEIAFIEQTLKEEKIEHKQAEIELHYFVENKDETPVLIAKQSDYNEFAKLAGKKELKLEADEVIVAAPSSANMMAEGQVDKLLAEPIKLADGSTIKAVKADKEKISPEILPEINAYYIIHDELFAKLPPQSPSEKSIAWHAEKGQKDKLIKAGEKIFDELDGFRNMIAVDYSLHMIQQFYGPVLFVGLFIGIVFFVSAGSFLYFRVYTDLNDDKEKFEAITKLGLSERELKKIISRQTAILFFAPIIVALVHGAVALTALSHMFDYSLVYESAIVLGSFFIIQVIYFLIVRYFYTRQIKLAIQ